MDLSFNTLNDLFMQLGLPNKDAEIETFIEQHQLAEGESIDQADFWTAAQASFLEECLQADSDWAEVVDQLSVQLRLK